MAGMHCKSGPLAGFQSYLESLPTKLPRNSTVTDAVVAEWRALIEGAVPPSREFKELKDMSLRFLDSPDAVTALENGHHELSLFGVGKHDMSIGYVNRWGIIPFLVWGVHTAKDPRAHNGPVCAIRTRSPYAVRQRPPQSCHFDQTVAWWRHPKITNATGGNQ